MSTSFTVPTVVRPISEDMFADVGAPVVEFTPLEGGRMQVTVPLDLTADQVMRAKARLLSPDAHREQQLWQAYQAWKSNKDYLAIPTPTQGNVVSQVRALTQQVNGLIEYLLPNGDQQQ